MKSINEFQWQGHEIKVCASASPRFLWLDNKVEILIDNEKADYRLDRSLTQSDARFTMQHQGKNLKGHIISQGLPGMPIVSLSTIIDDTIIGKGQCFVTRRVLSALMLAALLLSLQHL